MKVKVESIPEGVMICRVLNTLERAEMTLMTQGIEKLLANGKARIIIEFTDMAVVDRIGVKMLEKDLRPFQQLARKMGGDILYAVPKSFVGQIPHSYQYLATAIKDILKRVETPVGSTSHEKEGSEDAEAQLKALELENQALSMRIKELLNLAGQPSTDEELKKAVEFYKTLAQDMEAKSTASSAAQDFGGLAETDEAADTSTSTASIGSGTHNKLPGKR